MAARTFSVRLSGEAARDLARILAEHGLTFGGYWRWTQARLARLEAQNMALRAALRETLAGRPPSPRAEGLGGEEGGVVRAG